MQKPTISWRAVPDPPQFRSPRLHRVRGARLGSTACGTGTGTSEHSRTSPSEQTGPAISKLSCLQTLTLLQPVPSNGRRLQTPTLGTATLRGVRPRRAASHHLTSREALHPSDEGNSQGHGYEARRWPRAVRRAARGRALAGWRLCLETLHGDHHRGHRPCSRSSPGRGRALRPRGAAAQPLPSRGTEPSPRAPALRRGTALLRRGGCSPLPPAPPRKPPPPALSSAGGRRRGGKRRRGAAAPAALLTQKRDPQKVSMAAAGAQSLLREPPPGPRRAPDGGRRRVLPPGAGRGRGAAGPARPVPPSEAAAGGGSAAPGRPRPPQHGQGPRPPLSRRAAGQPVAAPRRPDPPLPGWWHPEGEGLSPSSPDTRAPLPRAGFLLSEGDLPVEGPSPPGRHFPWSVRPAGTARPLLSAGDSAGPQPAEGQSPRAAWAGLGADCAHPSRPLRLTFTPWRWLSSPLAEVWSVVASAGLQ